jgi:hypothetical protein
VSRTMHNVVPAYARRGARRVYVRLLVWWYIGSYHSFNEEGRSCMVVVVSRSSRQSWEIESFIVWTLTHQSPFLYLKKNKKRYHHLMHFLFHFYKIGGLAKLMQLLL